MPFGLKNAGATYTRMVARLIKDLIGKSMEAYVDDMLVKSREETDHAKDLADCFSVMRKYNLRLNSKKCAFAVRGGKFLGYMVTWRGFDPNPEKEEVLVCVGNTHEAFKVTEDPPRQFPPALKDCGRIVANQEGAKWEIEEMPSGRVMGDMLILPDGNVLIINGAQKGTSAWDAAEEPNFTPVLYSPDKPKGERFTELTPTKIARMYHSTSAVLPDAKILVAGSNTHVSYDMKAKYPTDMRVEKFSPPYLAPALQKFRPQIVENLSQKELVYGKNFNIHFKLDDAADMSSIKVTMYPPPFTTHGYSEGQRMLILGLTSVAKDTISAVAPSSGKLAPRGYYLIFVVHRGVPNKGLWVHIK
ncbi:PREDICTED: aldehyde oxidase GLOX1-like [Ipomoea nil]|uniref:aldehyde oxidase GLOX1-like n=1 Tax=Ipomoea nil TaxID=35883 RepID=UPI000901664A|nr:PREDICTED: aldehyde oxidase GLOX1-like [Ipomoea nil]